MCIRLLNWQRSIVIVGLIALLLLGNSSVFPETKMLWAGWWVQQQGLAHTIWETKKVRAKLPDWYLRLRVAIDGWRSWLMPTPLYLGTCTENPKEPKITAELLPLRFLKLTLFVKVLVNRSTQVQPVIG